VAIVVVIMVGPMIRWLDEALGWRLTGLGLKGAQALYQTVITLTLSFLVFTFGSLLVAIQIAGGQLTPRIIATTLLRDNVVRYSVGLLTFTLIFSVMALDRLEENVFHLVSLIVIVLGVLCMVTFLFLIDYAARLLRPVASTAWERGLGVIRTVYPDLAGEATQRHSAGVAGSSRRVVHREGSSEVMLAVDSAR
jgi:uncharacterized membrane protein